MMTIDKNQLLTFKEASQVFPTKPDRTTLWFWCTTGIKNRSTGKMCTLKSELHGGRRYTSIAWYEAFNAALNAGSEG